MTGRTQTLTAANIRFPWLFGWKYDLTFFFAPVFLAVALLALSQTSIILSSAALTFLFTQAFGLGAVHQGATWFHYLDKVNRRHYFGSRRNLLIFLIGPCLIMSLTTLGEYTFPAVVTAIYILWSIQHLVQQNVGILLLYHNHKMGEAVVDRSLEVRTQHLAAFFCSSLFFYRVFLHGTPNPAALAFFAAGFLAVLWFQCRYLTELRKQMSAGAYLNVPALIFWMISVYSLLPFGLFGRSYADAFLFPLIIHWCQYIGLNLILVKRKYASPDNAACLPVAKPFLLFAAAAGLLLAIVFGVGSQMTAGTIESSPLFRPCLSLLLGLGMIHYFLDAFIWRFREEFPRTSMLPYLRTRQSS